MYRSAENALRFIFSIAFISVLLLTPEAGVAASLAVTVEAPSAVMTPDQRVAQVLTRLTFGARPGDFDRVKKMGIDAYLAQQLDYSNIDDSVLQKRLDRLPTLNLPTPTLAEQYNPPKPPPTPTPSPSPTPAATPTPATEAMAASEIKPTPTPSPTPAPKPTPTPKNPQMVLNELQQAKLLRAVYSERQLYELTVDFWENHFSIYGNKDATRWMLTSFDREAVRPYALGRFRDLLGATAHSPAMLFYLDNWQSSLLREYPATKDKPARKTGGINENYARELMELHTLGVNGGYSQKDVQEVARCFTGWGVRKPNEEGLFVYNPNNHDNGEKVVLGVKIPAGGGIADGEKVLDILAKSPATAKFVTTKLARRFLGDEPPAAVVDRASKTFLATDGDITATIKSIVTSPAFYNAANYHSKVKTPFEYVASALRATNAQTDAGRPVIDWITRMGQPIYGRLTPDGYPDMSSEWLSNNDLIARFNFASALAMNNIKGTTVDAVKLVPTSDDASQAANEIARSLIVGDISDKTRKTLDKMAQDVSKTATPPTVMPASATTNAQPDARAKAFNGQLIALVLGAPEFLHK